MFRVHNCLVEERNQLQIAQLSNSLNAKDQMDNLMVGVSLFSSVPVPR